MPDRISPRAAGAVVYLALLAPTISAIGTMCQDAGRLAWLAPVFMIVPIAILMLFGRALDTGEVGFAKIYEQVFGRFVGKFICILYIIWMLFEAGAAARNFGIRLETMAYRGNVYVPFVVAMLALVAVSCRGGIKALGGVAGVFLPVIIAVLAAVCILSLARLRPQNLLPIGKEDFVGSMTVQSKLSVIPAVAVFAFFLPVKVKKTAPVYLALYIITASLTALTVLNAFGARLGASLDSAFFLAVKDISISGAIPRIEALVVALWTITDYMLIAFLVLAGTKILGEVFETEKNHIFSACLSAAVLLIAIFVTKPPEELIKIAACALAYLVPAVALIVKYVRRLGRVKQAKKE